MRFYPNPPLNRTKAMKQPTNQPITQPSNQDRETNPDTIIAAKVYSAFLHSARVLDHGSSLLALLMVLLAMRSAAVANALAGHGTGYTLVAMVLLAALEKYYAFRVALDARLFALLGEPGINDSAAFDSALVSLSGQAALPRSLQDRWRGARKLWIKQAACFAVQAVLLVGSVLGHLL
jgi:hypothetical protein